MTPYDPMLLARLYDGLGRLLLDGREPTLRALTAQLPALIEGLPETDPEALAVVHYRVLGREVPPYASVFCAAEGQVGGWVTEGYYRHYQAAGWMLSPCQEPADHLGQLLRFLAFCLQQQTSACQEAARRLLYEGWLAWLPLFTFAIARQEAPFMYRIASLVVELIQVHRAQVPPPERLKSLPWPDPAVPGPEADVAQLATYLTTPIRFGCYLSLADMQRLGRQLGLPVGFGRRAQVLATLLHTAALQGRACALLTALLALIDTWQRYLKACDIEIPIWQTRLETTRTLLQAACAVLERA